MSLDQWGRIRQVEYATAFAENDQPNMCFLAADGRVCGFSSSMGGAGDRAVIINDPQDLLSATTSDLGAPTITLLDGSVVPWYAHTGLWTMPVYVPDRDEFWCFTIISQAGAPIPSGFTRFAFWALIVDGGTMTATTTRCGFPQSDWPSDPADPIGGGRAGYDPTTGRIFLVHEGVDLTGTAFTTLTVNTINVNTRVLTLGTQQNMGPFPGGPNVPLGDLVPTGNYMVSVSYQFVADPRILQVNRSTLECTNQSVGYASASWGHGVAHGGKAYFPPGNGSPGIWLVANGSGWILTQAGLVVSSALGWDRAHVGPGGKILAYPGGSTSMVLAYDPDTDTQETYWDEPFTGAGGNSNRSIVLPNGNMMAPRGNGDEWKLVGLRPFPEAHGVPVQREPTRQYGPHAGAVVQPYQAGLDEPFALWITAHWDGGHWLVNEGTGGDCWDVPVFFEAHDPPPNPSYRMWGGWRHFIDLSDIDIETEFGGALGGPSAKPVTTITAFGDYEEFRDFVYTYSEILLRSGSSTWTLSRNEMSYDGSPGPDGFINYVRGTASYLDLTINDDGTGSPGNPDLRGRLLVITHDVHLGGIQVWIDGVSFPTTPTNTDTDYTWPAGFSEIDASNRYNADVPNDRSFFASLSQWDSMWCQFGQDSRDGPPEPGQPWTGLPLLALVRGEPTKEDMAAYYQLAYPAKSLPIDLQ